MDPLQQLSGATKSLEAEANREACSILVISNVKQHLALVCYNVGDPLGLQPNKSRTNTAVINQPIENPLQNRNKYSPFQPPALNSSLLPISAHVPVPVLSDPIIYGSTVNNVYCYYPVQSPQSEPKHTHNCPSISFPFSWQGCSLPQEHPFSSPLSPKPPFSNCKGHAHLTHLLPLPLHWMPHLLP